MYIIMGNGTSKTDINPYIFFPINTSGISVKDKIDQTLQYINSPCGNKIGSFDREGDVYTFKRDEFLNFLNNETTENKYIESYGDNNDANSSAVRVLLVCKDDNGNDKTLVDTLVKSNSIYKTIKGGDHDDSSSSSSSSTSELDDDSSNSSNSSSSSSSSSDDKKKKKKVKKETDSEGGSIHSYSLPTINSSDIRNMAENDVLTTNSVMEEAINKYNKLQRHISMNTSERDLLTDSEKFVNKKIIKNSKYD